MGIKFSQAYREMGLINLLFYALDRLLSRISNNNFRLYKYLLVVQGVKAKPILASHRANKICIKNISQHEANELSFPRPHKVIESRYHQSAHCLGAFSEDELVGFIWFNFGDYVEDEVRCIFSPQPTAKLAWDYDIYIAPNYRNGLTFVKLWDAANQFMREKKIEYSMSRISAFNSQSIASHKRMGAIKLGSAIFICLGKIQIFLATVPPYVHVSASDKAGPTIVLNVNL